MSAAVINPMGMRVEAPLTLTARGRRLFRAAAIALALLVVVFGGQAAAGGPPPAIAVDTYTVGPGETLWAIASAFTGPHEDVRETVGELVDLNRLAGGALRAGQQILVPAS